MNNWIDIGSNVYIEFTTCSHMEGPAGCLVRFGGTLDEGEGYDHDKICIGGINWCSECSGPTWELISLEPLHVDPSIRTICHNHPEHHGYIRNGRWESV